MKKYPDLIFVLKIILIFIFIVWVILWRFNKRLDNYMGFIDPEEYFAKNIPPELLSSLPPDPGKAGKTTIEGIDSDKDGIRDDVFRSITFVAPTSYNKREAMKQLAKAFQAHILSKTEEEAKKTDIFMEKSWECLFKLEELKLLEQGYAFLETTSIVKSIVVNTKQRRNAYDNAQRLMGTVFEYSFKEPCEFTIVYQ